LDVHHFYFGDFWTIRHDLWDLVFEALASVVYPFFVLDAFNLGMRLGWVRLVRDIRRKYILADLEKGGGDFQSSVDWWSEELSKTPFKEIERSSGS
jgi:hypothetical protein